MKRNLCKEICRNGTKKWSSEYLTNWSPPRGSRTRSDFCWLPPQLSTPSWSPVTRLQTGLRLKSTSLTCKSPSPAKELPVTSSTVSLPQHCSLEAGSNSPASWFKERFKVSKLMRGDMSGSVASWFKDTSSSFKLFKESKGGRPVSCKHFKFKESFDSRFVYLIPFQYKGGQICQVDHFSWQGRQTSMAHLQFEVYKCQIKCLTTSKKLSGLSENIFRSMPFFSTLSSTLLPVNTSSLLPSWVVSVREGVRMKKTFLNGHCPYRSYPPLPRGATGNVVLFSAVKNDI